MIKLSYQLSKEWNSRVPPVDYAVADEMTLRYSAFLGDQIFFVDSIDFSARWGWVPLLDFAACLSVIVVELKAGSEESIFEFTESDAQLQFNRLGNDVSVTSSYINGKATLSLKEFEAAIKNYASKIRKDAVTAYPLLEMNPSFKDWFPIDIKSND